MSTYPRFFSSGPLIAHTTVSLDEGTAKHIWQVLRMQADEKITLTDGKGSVGEGTLQTVERHKCDVLIDKVSFFERTETKFHLCVCFTKNNSRNEWLLEKATELGVCTLVPISAKRSEKTYFRDERWHKILTSAILQSQQHYLPELTNIMSLKEVLQAYKDVPQKFVAHCISEIPRHPLSGLLKPGKETIILIGPEGDFTAEEVNLCLDHGFQSVSLGAQRLRTETAAITAGAYFNVVNDNAKM